MDIFPGKIFRRQSGVTGTPSTASSFLTRWRKHTDVPDQSAACRRRDGHPVNHARSDRCDRALDVRSRAVDADGVCGLSMKTVIKNIDDHLLKPIGEAYFPVEHAVQRQ